MIVQQRRHLIGFLLWFLFALECAKGRRTGSPAVKLVAPGSRRGPGDRGGAPVAQRPRHRVDPASRWGFPGTPLQVLGNAVSADYFRTSASRCWKAASSPSDLSAHTAGRQDLHGVDQVGHGSGPAGRASRQQARCPSAGLADKLSSPGRSSPNDGGAVVEEVGRVRDASGPQGIALHVQQLGAVGLRDACRAAGQHQAMKAAKKKDLTGAGGLALIRPSVAPAPDCSARPRSARRTPRAGPARSSTPPNASGRPAPPP